MEAIALLLIYLMPTILAFTRGHKNAEAISLLNILLGWTIIGWIGAIIWSATCNIKQKSI